MQKLGRYIDKDKVVKTLFILERERRELKGERDKYAVNPPRKLITEITKRTKKINILERVLLGVK